MGLAGRIDFLWGVRRLFSIGRYISGVGRKKHWPRRHGDTEEGKRDFFVIRHGFRFGMDWAGRLGRSSAAPVQNWVSCETCWLALRLLMKVEDK
jgi:hypothetical protein